MRLLKMPSFDIFFRECIGFRKILGHVDGHFDGKPVKKVSKSPTYQTLTYSEFKTKTEQIASGLKAKYGLVKGDKVNPRCIGSIVGWRSFNNCSGT